jgi:hypothetical protein
MPFSVIAKDGNSHLRFGTDSAMSRLNPKLEAPNPKQIRISRFQIQDHFEHYAFDHFVLSGILHLDF